MCIKVVRAIGNDFVSNVSVFVKKLFFAICSQVLMKLEHIELLYMRCVKE